MINPDAFNWGQRIQEGMQQSQDNRRKNALLDLDQRQFGLQERQVGLQEQRLAQADAERQAQMQAAQRKESIGLRALAAARGDKQSGMAILQELGLPGELADDPDAGDLFGAIAEQYGGFELGQSAAQPSNVQEWEYYNRLPPDQKRQFLEMKRSPTPPQVVMVGGAPTLVNRSPDAYGAQTPLSTQDAEVQAAARLEAGKVGARESVQAQAKAAADVPRVEANAQAMIDILDQLEKSPGFDWVFGVKSLAPVIPGTPQADAIAVWEQVQGKAFLEAFATLKGGGQITEKEGEKATAAMTRLANRKQSPAAAKQAILELRALVRRGAERARKAAGQSVGGAPNTVRRFNPATGKIE